MMTPCPPLLLSVDPRELRIKDRLRRRVYDSLETMRPTARPHGVDGSNRDLDSMS